MQGNKTKHDRPKLHNTHHLIKPYEHIFPRYSRTPHSWDCSRRVCGVSFFAASNTSSSPLPAKYVSCGDFPKPQKLNPRNIPRLACLPHSLSLSLSLRKRVWTNLSSFCFRYVSMVLAVQALMRKIAPYPRVLPARKYRPLFHLQRRWLQPRETAAAAPWKSERYRDSCGSSGCIKKVRVSETPRGNAATFSLIRGGGGGGAQIVGNAGKNSGIELARARREENRTN